MGRMWDMRKWFSSALVLIVIVILCSTSIVQGETKEIKTGTVTGLIAIKSIGPMMGGTVFFFNVASGPAPSATRYWRVPTDAFSMDENGRFTVTLPGGKYYMGAIERATGEALGPPREGDYFFISTDKKGRPKVHTVKADKMTDFGVLYGGASFSRATLAKKGITSLEGTIRNERGDPVAELLVFAFSTPSTVGRPLFVSDRSDKDGKYLLRLSGGGKYYLRARANYGGPPSTDELMGVFKGGKPVSVHTAAKRKGIDITVSHVGVAVPRP
jgi:hypothetical protein